ncbi:MAG: LCP family protein [Akkermansiaceae bacterium]|nr:LCP family protein [Armatimonadota bacterium]
MKRMVTVGIAAGILGVFALLAGKALQVGTAMGGKQGIVGAWQGFNDPLGQFPANTQRVNILLIGKDYNHTNKGILYTKASRSDTLIVFSLDLRNKTVSALSIPRDTYIAERRGKINAAFAQGGAPMAVETVGKLLGVYPDYFIALKPDSVKELVNEIGGVEVTALDAMKYDDNWGGLHIDLPEGTYSINGDQAVGYTRFRKSNDGLPRSIEEGDARRMARQQNLVRAMISKAKSPAVLMRADTLINTAFKQVETDLSETQLLALATIFRETEPDKITSASLIGEDGRAGGLYVFKPDTEKTTHLVDWLLRGDLGAANALTVVAVQNGTKIKGAARRIADSLKGGGFDARPDGNVPKAPGGDVPEELSVSRIVYHKASYEERAKSIARMVGVSDVVKEALPPAEEAGTSQGDDAERPADVTVLVGLDVAKRDALQQSASRE